MSDLAQRLLSFVLAAALAVAGGPVGNAPCVPNDAGGCCAAGGVEREAPAPGCCCGDQAEAACGCADGDEERDRTPPDSRSSIELLALRADEPVGMAPVPVPPTVHERGYRRVLRKAAAVPLHLELGVLLN